jgi:hypothetical protein
MVGIGDVILQTQPREAPGVEETPGECGKPTVALSNAGFEEPWGLKVEGSVTELPASGLVLVDSGHDAPGLGH